MRWWMIPWVGLVACGPSVDDDPQAGTGGDSVSGSATGSMTSGSSSEGTPTSPTATATATTLATTTGTDLTSETGASSTGSDTTTVSTGIETGDGSTGKAACGEDAEYQATDVSGGLERVQIFRTDPDSGECFLLMVAAPMKFSEYDVETTRPWALERALVSPDANDCDNPLSTEGFAPIPDAEGMIDVSLNADGRPCALAVDVTLQLQENPAPPVYVEFCHPEISVGGCML